MAIKAHPLKTWDDLDITDAIRLGVAGSELLFSAALSCIKGDWAEFCSNLWFCHLAIKTISLLWLLVHKS